MGQHFLRNLAAADQIVDAFAPGQGEPILEIGPGRGILTERLLAAGALVVAVEKDERLAATLRDRLRGRLPAAEPIEGQAAGDPDRPRPDLPGLVVVTGDALEVDLGGLLRPHLLDSGFPKARAIGNLPYSVGAAILSRLLMAADLFSGITVMLQAEVADRICAPPGSRTYGSLSVLAQYFSDPRTVMRLAPGSFDPKPKVTGAVVVLPIREPRDLPRDRESAYPRFIRSLFQQRRRTLPHNLTPAWGSDLKEIAARLTAMGIDPSRRPETLTREECLRIFPAALP